MGDEEDHYDYLEETEDSVQQVGHNDLLKFVQQALKLKDTKEAHESEDADDTNDSEELGGTSDVGSGGWAVIISDYLKELGVRKACNEVYQEPRLHVFNHYVPPLHHQVTFLVEACVEGHNDIEDKDNVDHGLEYHESPISFLIEAEAIGHDYRLVEDGEKADHVPGSTV